MPLELESGVCDLPANIAEDAGRCILEVFLRGDAIIRRKEDGSIVTSAGLVAQEIAVARLPDAFPSVPIVSEEFSDLDNQAALRHQFLILDPLDGTKNFADGIPFFNVTIGLVEDGRVVAGVVRDPVHALTYSASRDAGDYVNGGPIHVHACSGLGLADVDINATRLSRSVYEQLALHIAPRVRQVRYFGCAILETCWIACGRLDGMVNHNLSTWDIAAVSLILEEAGGCWGHLMGQRYRLDSLDKRPFVATGDKRVMTALVEAMRVR